jgi:hypothetical protein
MVFGVSERNVAAAKTLRAALGIDTGNRTLTIESGSMWVSASNRTRIADCTIGQRTIRR